MKVAHSLQGQFGFQDLIFSLKTFNEILYFILSRSNFDNITPKIWREFKSNESDLTKFVLKYSYIFSPFYLVLSMLSKVRFLKKTTTRWLLLKILKYFLCASIIWYHSWVLSVLDIYQREKFLAFQN